MPTNRDRSKKQSELSAEQLARADLVIRQTYEKLQVLFMKVSNIQADMQSIQEGQKRLIGLVAHLFDDPEARRHAENVLKQYVYTRNK